MKEKSKLSSVASCGKTGRPKAACDGGLLSPGEFVLQEHLQELDVAELAGPGLGEPHLQGVEHTSQLERLQASARATCEETARSSLLLLGPKGVRAVQPRRHLDAGEDLLDVASFSVPAIRMPLTVR